MSLHRQIRCEYVQNSLSFVYFPKQICIKMLKFLVKLELVHSIAINNVVDVHVRLQSECIILIAYIFHAKLQFV